MTDARDSKPNSLTRLPLTGRRRFLAGAGALTLSSALAAPFVARASTSPFKLGVLLPFSGGLELFGEQGMQGIRMAVNETNAAGGVLGRQIEIVQADDRTDPRTAVERATQLIRRDEVNAIIGPVTSANRDAIKSTIERGQTPLLYATDYEGGVCSDWIACYSPLPAHYVDPLIPFLNEGGSSSYYLFGADYIWPQLMNKAIRAVVEGSQRSIAEEEYTPFGVRDFAPTIRRIGESGADTIILTLPGADGVTFLKQLHAAGLRSRLRVAFLGFNENYLPGFDPAEVEGVIAPVPFHQRLDRPEAEDFVARQRAAYGENTVVSYYAESHYGITSFYLDAVRRADSDDRAAVMAALPGQTKVFGNGEVTLRASDKHVDLNMIIAQVAGGVIDTHTYIGQVAAPSQCSA